MSSLHTPICDLLGLDYPIFLAGMGVKGRGTPPALVAAVSNGGGLGVIGAGAYGADRLREVIRETRRLTGKPIGVNVIMPAGRGGPGKSRAELRAEIEEKFPDHVRLVRALRAQFALPETQIPGEIALTGSATSDSAEIGAKGDSATVFREQLEVIAEERVEVVAPALGSCRPVVERLGGTGARILALSGRVEHGVKNIAAGADAIVAQGLEAGGHVGSVANFALIPAMAAAIAPHPVIAAGSITDGRGLVAALALGAQGAWIGTGFLVASECGVHDTHKRQIVEGRVDQFTASSVYAGSPVRGFRNAVIEAWEQSGLAPLPGQYQKVLMDDFDAAVEAAGRYELQNNPAGQGAGNIRAIRPAAEIMAEIVETARAVMARLTT